MNVRAFDLASDYSHASAWWTDHGWGVVPERLLSPTGFMAEDGDTRAAACWLYFADSAPLVMLEWLVANPELSGLRAMRAIDAVVDAALRQARAEHGLACFTTCRQPALVRLYERHGFFQTDTGVTHLVANLRT